MPDTDFISVGNSREVEADQLGVGTAITALVPGTTVIRVVDRDLRSEPEIAELQAAGVRVLGRRHLESFLLEDEVLRALCVAKGQPEKTDEVLAIKEMALRASIERGNDPDDLKRAAGDIYTNVRQALAMVQPGNNTEAFLSDTLAPLLTAGTGVFEELRQNIFG